MMTRKFRLSKPGLLLYSSKDYTVAEDDDSKDFDEAELQAAIDKLASDKAFQGKVIILPRGKKRI